MCVNKKPAEKAEVIPTRKKSYGKTIFELQITELAADRTRYPVVTARKTIGFFSTLKRAEVFLRQVATVRAHHSTIKVRILDIQESDDSCARRTYDRQGQFCGLCLPISEPFAGVEREKCRFSEGEIVEIIHNGLLRPGIISLLPISPARAACIPIIDQSDNSYCVELSGCGRKHSHVSECDIFIPMFPVGATTKTCLLRTYRSLKTS